ncbi:exodeoxyribonuclease VII small subunit [Stappia stellulata]|uniref:exodeoxyribonuclease VII small subunit n=1 Tax=Stappia stellulata TaxID=71235 RepID=UPI0006885085|nr:exodeoxyribonuclease VII small subunit [Stappia stellulata]
MHKDPQEPVLTSESTDPGIEALSFEAALKELEEIVGRLERGDVPLEESIKLYSRGDALRRQCDRLLKSAEAKVEKIQLAEDGSASGTTPLDVD